MESLNILGGKSPYIIPEIQSFCEDLKQLKNTSLVSDIANRINKIMFTNTCSDLVPPINAVFKDLSAPQTVKDKIKHLAKQLDQSVGLEKSSEKQGVKRKNIQDGLHQIAQNLLTWVKEQEKNPLYTKEVKILLDISELKMCNDETIESILKVITTSSNGNLLKEKILPICENSNLQDHFNTHSWKYDLESLCHDIIRKKPEQRRGFASLLENQPEFFCQKKITILPKEKGDAVEGRIESVTKYPSKYIFTLNNSTLIEIEKSSYKVEILTPKSIKLISMIRTQSIDTGKVIDLPNDELLKRGSYKIESYNTSVDSLSVKLKGVESGETGEIIVNNDNKAVVVVEEHGSRMDHRYNDIEKTEVITMIRTSFQHIRDAETLNQYVMLSDSEENVQKKIEDLTKQINGIFEKNMPLLDLLVEDYIRRTFDSIQLDTSELSKELKQKLEEIIALHERLGEEITVEGKLISIIQNFIYKTIVKDEDKLKIANIMKILMEGNKHIEEIKGKTIIPIWGFTGAGKSTVVNYLLGLKLVESKRIAGEFPKWQLQKKEDAKKGATIGLSDGCSETLYPHAYILDDKKVIVDYPGFRDTRGDTMRICSSICTDQAVLQAAALQAIVAVAPMTYFLGEDKYEKLIELIDSLIERFPNAFSENKEGTPPIYLLITKRDKVPDNFWKEIVDGSHFQKLIDETNAQLEQLGSDQIAERLKVWKIIASLYSNKRIDVVNYSNQSHRDELLEKYSKSDSKSEPILQNNLIYEKSIQKYSDKFQGIMHSYASTWINLILKPYLNEIPKNIKELKEKIDNAAEAVEKVKLLQGVLPEEYLEKNKAKTFKETELNRIKNKEVLDPFLEEELNIDFSIHHSTIMTHEYDIKLYEHLIKTIEEFIKICKTNIQKNQTANKEKSEQSSALKKENRSLAKGRVEVNLVKGTSTAGYLRDLKVGDKFQVAPVKMGDKVVEFNVGVKQNLFFTLSPHIIRERIVGKFKGTITYLCKLEKKYMIAPIGTDLIKQFEKEGKLGEYETEIRGVGIDNIQGDVSGQKNFYWIDLEWKDDSKQENVPWFEIVHIIPRAQYHRQQIETNQTKIEKIDKEIQENNSSIVGEENYIRGLIHSIEMQKDKIEWRKRAITSIYELIDGVKTAKKEEKKKLYLSSLKKMTGLREDEAFLCREKELQDQIESQETMLNSLQEKLKAEEKKQKLYALLIRTQWNKAQLMRKLIESYVVNEEQLDADQNGDAITRKNNLTFVCKEFNAIFDQQKSSLIGNVESMLRHADCSDLCSSFLAPK